MIFLVRHAKAGERRPEGGEDQLRPLSRAGRRQAAALLDVLGEARFERILSSPYVRCLETVVPLAGARSLPIEPVEALAEGAPVDDAAALVRKHAEHGAVMCSHGDVIPALLEHFFHQGVTLGAEPRWPKGSTWVLETAGTEVVGARYLPPVG